MPIKHLLLLWLLVVGAAALTLLVMFVIGLSLAILLPLALIAAVRVGQRRADRRDLLVIEEIATQVEALEVLEVLGVTQERLDLLARQRAAREIEVRQPSDELGGEERDEVIVAK